MAIIFSALDLRRGTAREQVRQMHTQAAEQHLPPAPELARYLDWYDDVERRLRLFDEHCFIATIEGDLPPSFPDSNVPDLTSMECEIVAFIYRRWYVH